MLPFDRARFTKILALALTLVFVCFAIAIWLQGSIAARDIVGSLITAVLASYLLHLWMMPPEDEPAED